MAVATGPGRSAPARWYPLAMLTPAGGRRGRVSRAPLVVRVAAHIVLKKNMHVCEVKCVWLASRSEVRLINIHQHTHTDLLGAKNRVLRRV